MRSKIYRETIWPQNNPKSTQDQFCWNGLIYPSHRSHAPVSIKSLFPPFFLLRAAWWGMDHGKRRPQPEAATTEIVAGAKARLVWLRWASGQPPQKHGRHEAEAFRDWVKCVASRGWRGGQHGGHSTRPGEEEPWRRRVGEKKHKQKWTDMGKGCVIIGMVIIFSNSSLVEHNLSSTKMLNLTAKIQRFDEFRFGRPRASR